MTHLLLAPLLGAAALAAAAAPESPFLDRPSRAPQAEVSTAAASGVRVSAGPEPAYARALRLGHAAYFRGEYAEAVARYEAAIRISSAGAAPWVNGGAVLDEAGAPARAASWYARAAQLGAADEEVVCALGWAQLRSPDPAAAAASFRRVLQRDPDHRSALQGMARAELAASRPQQAVTLLTRAAGVSPFAGLNYLTLGRAYEALGDFANAIGAYRQGLAADSYFLEARKALGRAYLRARRYNEAFRQLSRAMEADPHDPAMAALLAKVQPLLSPAEAPGRLEGTRPPLAAAPSPSFPEGMPVVRVGIGTNAMGRPRARRSFVFSATTDFWLVDAKTGARLARAKADEPWVARLKRSRRRLVMELAAASGSPRLERRAPWRIVPDSRDQGLVALNLFSGVRGPAATAEKLLRGEVEVSLFQRTLRIVNRIDLENYTHGVLAAEMPIRSPLEALKAQAVLARTHALFIATMARRHRRDGYDICDEQHCQVYAGARAESERSRPVVEATRGIIVTYRGKPAHVIYSSNCGGHTQDGRDLTGWGGLPYWIGIADLPAPQPAPDSPWALRQWLTAMPQAFCKPSSFVHPSHFRWTRSVPWAELSRGLDRRYRIGRLKRLRTLRRSPSGNINALLIEGTRRRLKVDSEMAIRGLPGLGSLRSTAFLFTPELGADGKPESLAIIGGGWGHGVGLCQSGAMGRAEAGQDFLQIILSYFPGTALGRSDASPSEARWLP